MLVIASEVVPTGNGTMGAFGKGSGSTAWAAAVRGWAGGTSTGRDAGGVAGGWAGFASGAAVLGSAAGAAGFDRRGLSHLGQRILPGATDAPHMTHLAKVGPPPGGTDVTPPGGRPQR
jgi:hypothetical protein